MTRVRLGQVAVPMVLGLLVACESAVAMQFGSFFLDDGRAAIVARGPIVEGDTERLRQTAAALPRTSTIAAIILDSPGGDVLVGEELAEIVSKLHLPVFVLSGSECSSACFLVFACASRRIVATDALIGVHSASDSGKETIPSLALTTAFARDAAACGVPPAIIGKMVETPPGRLAWLTPNDLALMGVSVAPDATAETEHSPPLAAPYAALPSAQSPAASNGFPNVQASRTPPDTATGEQSTSLTFQQGLADRRAWEEYFNGLTGDFRAGAESWAERRSTPKPGSCYAATHSDLGAWTAGCLAAQQRLGPSDRRRKAEPDYRLGWNAY